MFLGADQTEVEESVRDEGKRITSPAPFAVNDDWSPLEISFVGEIE